MVKNAWCGLFSNSFSFLQATWGEWFVKCMNFANCDVVFVFVAHEKRCGWQLFLRSTLHLGWTASGFSSRKAGATPLTFLRMVPPTPTPNLLRQRIRGKRTLRCGWMCGCYFSAFVQPLISSYLTTHSLKKVVIFSSLPRSHSPCPLISIPPLHTTTKRIAPAREEKGSVAISAWRKTGPDEEN